MFSYAADTHQGNVRKLNEDCYAADPELGLWLVADGVGGHAKGDVASQLTRATIESAYKQTRNLVKAIESAHEAVLAAIAENRGGANMGSTVVAAVTGRDSCELAWVGDSRAYLWNGDLTLLTRDHSVVEALIDKGVITREQGFQHPQRHIITQSIGVSAKSGLKIDSTTVPWQTGDCLLLCSDGLNDEVAERDIADTLASNNTLHGQVNALIAQALNNGGRDNITVLIIGNEERATDNAGGESPHSDKSQLIEASLDLDRHTVVVHNKDLHVPSGKIKGGFKKIFAESLIKAKNLFR